MFISSSGWANMDLIYQQEWGLLNTFINLFNKNDFEYAWLAKPETSLISVIISWSWQQTSLSMIIYLAGLTAIPRIYWNQLKLKVQI